MHRKLQRVNMAAGQGGFFGYLFPLSFTAVTRKTHSRDKNSHVVFHTSHRQHSYMGRKELGLGDMDVFLSLESCKELQDCTSHCLLQPSAGMEAHHSHTPVQGGGLCRTATFSSHDTTIARLLTD